MKNNRFITGFLLFAGLAGLYVGIGLVFFPTGLQESNGIMLSSPSHFSETRAPGSAILAASAIAFLGAFRSRVRRLSLTISALFFISYGVGRLFSLMLDGMPSDGLFYAMIGELIVGAIALYLLMTTNRVQSSERSEQVG